MSTFYFSPAAIIGSALNILSEIIVDSQLVLGIAVGVSVCMVLVAVVLALRRMVGGRSYTGKYDPASPPYSPALHSKAAEWP
jgi:hypothetical protein